MIRADQRGGRAGRIRTGGGKGARALLAVLGLAAAAQAAHGAATAEGALDDGEPRVAATLLVHPDTRSFSAPVRVGVLLEMDPGWHVYWRHPGQTGLPTRLAWSASDGEVGPVEWPAPERFEEGDGLFTTYGYDEEVLLASPVDFQPGGDDTRRVAVDVDLLACQHECIPASFSLERTLVRGASVRADAARLRRLFSSAAARVPDTPERLGVGVEVRYSQDAIRPGDRFRAALLVHSCRRSATRCQPYAWASPAPFVPHPPETIGIETQAAILPPSGHGRSRTLRVELEGEANETPARSQERLRGVLALQGGDGRTRHVEVDLPLPRAERGASIQRAEAPSFVPSEFPPPQAGNLSLLYVLALAFLGGLVLNAMPCVVPVLAIKVCAVAELAHRDRREVLAHGLAYAAGILASMGVLAGAVIALRAAGHAVGWGFQFQEPFFLMVVSTVLVVFALNLFGVFEIGLDTGRLAGLGASATGARRSFFEGLLAVVLATPCSAPFLGTAAGFAFAGSPGVIVSVFALIGLGLAAPFLLISWVPAWARVVPRSGSWTLKLRVVLGFLLLGSVAWLLWILGRSAGADGVVTLLVFHLVVAFGAWVYGTLQTSRPRWLPGAAVGGALAIAAGGYNGVSFQAVDAAPGGGPETLSWTVYDRDAVQAVVAEGRPAFVVFTADWCLTCKLNERTVLSHERVTAEFERRRVALFRADWTRRDEGIRAELARFGRAGVPMYLAYPPGEPQRPQLLPELLTIDTVLDALGGEADETDPRAAGSPA